MKLVTFLDSRSLPGERLGVFASSQSDLLIDVLSALPILGASVNFSDMLGLIREQASALPLLKQLLSAQAEGRIPRDSLRRENEVTLLSPIPRPVSLRDGYAFRQHVEAARRNRGVPMIPEFDHFPIYYYTNHLAVTGPGRVPVQKKTQEKLDFELEVAIVVGRPGMNIPAGKADEFIFGYMIMNDWSARALQLEEMKLNLGPAKGKDFATSLGPYLVTRDELAPVAVPGPSGERHSLKMKAFVNDRQVAEGNLKDMSWTFAQILERVSYGVALQPGEVIGSGTVGTGCFLENNGSPQSAPFASENQWLKPGDRVAMEVERLGRLENEIVDAPESFVETRT